MSVEKGKLVRSLLRIALFALIVGAMVALAPARVESPLEILPELAPPTGGDSPAVVRIYLDPPVDLLPTESESPGLIESDGDESPAPQYQRAIPSYRLDGILWDDPRLFEQVSRTI